MTSFSICWEKPTAVFELEELIRSLELPQATYVDLERFGF